MVELCRLRHSAAESWFFNFTLAKIDEKSLGRGSGVSWASLVSPWVLWVALWVLLGVFLGLSGCSRVSFWIPWVVAGGSLVLLGWPLGATWRFLGVPQVPLGSSWVALWRSGRLLGVPGVPLGSSWVPPRRSEGLLGISWAPPVYHWVLPWCLLGVSRVSPGRSAGISWVFV